MTDAPDILPIRTEFMFRIDIRTCGERVHVVKGTPWGDLVNVPVIGGTVEGPKLSGEVLEIGGDWGVSVPQDDAGTMTELDCKLMIRTHDDSLIQMSYGGIGFYHPGVAKPHGPAGSVIDPEGYYFRISPRFRTAAPKYSFLNRTVAIASGYHRVSAGPIYDVHAVL